MNAIILSAVWGVVMMFSGVFLKSKDHVRIAAIFGALLLLVTNSLEMSGHSFFQVNTSGMIRIDRFNLLFNEIILFCTLIYFLLSGSDILKIGNHGAEYFALMFFVLCGVGLAVSFTNLLILFIGIEIISIPLYILTGSDKRNLKGNEAALKYFLMGSFSTGIMLMGIALLYGASPDGSFFIDKLGITADRFNTISAVGIVLLLVAMSFKVSAAPFHFWTPDAYDGAPIAITSFMSTIVKAAAFVAFLRLFNEGFGTVHLKWKLLVAVITAATLFIGNITAVFQNSVKRMMAYSSIAQAGFMLLSIFALNTQAKEGLILYTTAYSLATIGVFAILIKMDDYTIDGFRGLAKSQPLVAFTMTVFLLSLAGIPVTSGFLAKYYMLLAVVKGGMHIWLVIFAVLCAAVSVYYYFKVIQAMYFKEGDVQFAAVTASYPWILSLLAVLVILLGLFPDYLLTWLYYDLF
jgi:NADH-quinone oxidoreductase subunit N